MSFFELANFLKTQASGNEQLSLVFENLEKEIIEYTQLRSQELALHDEEFRLQMEARLWESWADHVEEYREHQKSVAKEISELNDNFMKLSTPLKKLNMNEVVGNKILVQGMQFQEEKKEIVETLRQKKEMLEGMENRIIVQKLRRTQKEYQEALERKQKAEEFKESSLKQARQKLQSALEQRNELIVNMVKDANKLETTRREKINGYEQKIPRELEEKKCELMTKLQYEQNQQICTSTTSSISNANATLQESYNILENLPTFDPRNPMAFLKFLNLDIDTDKIMQEFSLELQKKESQKEAERDTEKITELRSILRNKNDANDNVESENIKSSTQHVQFLESDISCDSFSCSSSLSRSFSPLDYVKTVNSDLAISSTIESVDNVEIINLLTPANEMSEANGTDIEMSTKSRPVVEILECKTIKPAGTALPKSIPFTLSPPTPISDKEKQFPVATIISENFKVPQPPEPTNKLEPLKQESNIDTKSKPTEKASTSKHSLKNMNVDFSFESLLLSNKSQSSESDSDSDFKPDVITDSNADNFMLAFDSNVENTNTNSDNDAFEINFSDSDMNSAERRISFDL